MFLGHTFIYRQCECVWRHGGSGLEARLSVLLSNYNSSKLNG